jgi:predicted porin
MKKTLIASAVAVAALSTTSVFAMGEMSEMSEMKARMNAMPTVYGNIQLAYEYTKEDPDGGSEVETNDFFDNGSTIGVKHSHDIAPGLTGFLKAELEFDADNKKESTGLSNLDEAYIGVKGDFGSVQVGTDDTPYEWFDVIDVYEAVGIYGEFKGVNEGDNLQYVSPTIAGGLTIGVSLALDSTEAHDGSLGVKYKTDIFEAILSYALGRDEGGVDTGDAVGLGANVFLGDFTIGAEFEKKAADSVGGTDDKSTDQTGFGVIGIYNLGSNKFAAGYYHAEDDADTESDQVHLQALHSLSGNMYAYVEYVVGTEDVGSNSTDTDEMAIGAVYSF